MRRIGADGLDIGYWLHSTLIELKLKAVPDLEPQPLDRILRDLEDASGSTRPQQSPGPR